MVVQAGLRPVGGHRRDGWLVWGLAALLAAVVVPVGLLIGPDGGLIPLHRAVVHQHSAIYGSGWWAWMHQLVDDRPVRVFELHRWGSTLVAPLVWWTTRGILGADARLGPLTAGLMTATLPLLLRLGGSESIHVTVLVVEALAMAALVVCARRGTLVSAVVAGLGVGLVPHLRPETLPFVVAPAVVWWVCDRKLARPAAWWLAVGLAVVVAMPRLLDVAPLMAGSGSGVIDEMSGPGAVDRILRPWMGWGRWHRGENVVFLNPKRTPIGLMALVGWALWTDRQRAGALVGFGVFQLLLVAPKFNPMVDAWRLQLPAMLPFLLAAGLGAHQRATLRGPKVVASVLTALPLMVWVRQDWAPRDTVDAVVAGVRGLPSGATLLLAGGGATM